MKQKRNKEQMQMQMQMQMQKKKKKIVEARESRFYAKQSSICKANKIYRTIT